MWAKYLLAEMTYQEKQEDIPLEMAMRFFGEVSRNDQFPYANFSKYAQAFLFFEEKAGIIDRQRALQLLKEVSNDPALETHANKLLAKFGK